jgi:glycosyltransferase 2 family protein
MRQLKDNLWLNIAVIVLLTIFGLGVALFDSYELAFESLRQLTGPRLVMILMLGVSPTLLWGYILSLMAKQVDRTYTIRKGITNAFIGGFMSGITPSSTGGQLAQINTFKKHGLNTFQAAGIVWMDFYLYTMTLVLMTLVLFFFNVSNFENLSITLIFGLGLMVNIVIVGVLASMVVRPDITGKLTNWTLNKISTLKWIKHKERFIDFWMDSLSNFHKATTVIHTNNRMMIGLVLLNTLRLLVYFASPFAISQIINQDLPWADLSHLLALSAFVSITNTFVPLPGATGATESVFVLAYSTVIGKAAAASTMILWRFSTFHVILMVGAFFFLRTRHLHIRDLNKKTMHDESY